MSKGQNISNFSSVKIEEASLDELYHVVSQIWRRDRRERSMLDLWLNVVSKAGAAVESIRREEYGSAVPAVADVAIWVLRFIAQANEPGLPYEHPIRIEGLPTDLLWNKFPGMCPACLDYEVTSLLTRTLKAHPRRFRAKDQRDLRHFLDKKSVEFSEPVACQCLSRHSFAESRHKVFAEWNEVLCDARLYYADVTRERGKKIVGLNALEEMFSKIFASAYQFLSLEQIAFHLLEEVSEVAKALADCYMPSPGDELHDNVALRLRLKELEEELADVLSWLFAVELKIRHMLCKSALDLMGGLKLPSNAVELRIDLHRGTALSEMIRSKYAPPGGTHLSDLWCPNCHAAPCKCPITPTVAWAELQAL